MNPENHIQTSEPPRAVRQRWLDALVVICAVAVAVAVFALLAHARTDVGPLRVSVAVKPALAGVTVVELPPFGDITARTHAGPVAVTARVDQVDVEKARSLLESSALTAAAADPEAALAQAGSGAVWPLGLRIVTLGLLGALAAAALVALAARRSRGTVAVAVATAAAVILVPIGVAAATWDARAFREPVLHGALGYAPQVVDGLSTRLASIERLRAQALQVADDVAGYYADDRSIAQGGSLEGTMRVLHVSDLHLDPVGAALGGQLARSYEATLVIDTGDLPVFGDPFEGQAVQRLVDTSVRRVYVPGNHDSPATVAVIRALPNTSVLDSGTVDVAGLTIFGVPDPVSRSFGHEPDKALVADEAAQAFRSLEALMRSGEATPDIVAVHNPAMEGPFIGIVPVILSGHTHSARSYTSKGTLRLNSGTLGGMPYDPVGTGRDAVPYSASVLYYTAQEPRRLIAVDRIAVSPDRSTTVTRQIIDESLLP